MDHFFESYILFFRLVPLSNGAAAANSDFKLKIVDVRHIEDFNEPCPAVTPKSRQGALVPVIKIEKKTSRKPVLINNSEMATQRKNKRTRHNVFSCFVCSKDFPSNISRDRHLTTKHPIKFRCRFCVDRFRTQHSLDFHENKHFEKLKNNNSTKEGYLCCKKFFPCKDTLVSHVIHHNFIFECNECRKKYTSRQYLVTHMKTHLNMHQCENCGKKLISRDRLYRHKSKCQSLKHKCCECDNEYKNYHALKAHMYSLHFAKFVCRFCGKGYDTELRLQDHERIHTGERPFTCDFCKKSYFSLRSIKYHMKQHLLDSAFQCDICKKLYKCKSYLRLHLITVHHKGPKRFKCNLCKHAFSTRGCLKIHMVVHTGEKKFECTLCKILFSYSNTLGTHNKNFHSKIKPLKKHQCTYCEKSFVKPAHLTRHVFTHTGERPHGCDLCDFKFAQASQLRTHKMMKHKILPYECKKCGERFKIKSDMLAHFIEH